MQTVSFIVTAKVLALALLFVLNFHVLRTREGFRIMTKGRMGFRDVYMDARGWGLRDCLNRPKKIRNYLVFEKHFGKLARRLKTRNGNSAKAKVRGIEKSVHRWIAKKLR